MTPAGIPERRKNLPRNPQESCKASAAPSARGGGAAPARRDRGPAPERHAHALTQHAQGFSRPKDGTQVAFKYLDSQNTASMTLLKWL